MACMVFRRMLHGLSVLLILVAAAPLAPAADVVEIEEHWSLSVGGPEVARSAPQVSMVMSASGGTASDFFMVSLNHWAEPQFVPGGIQVQHWCGESCVRVANATTTQSLSNDGETIRWTQRLSIVDGKLIFEIVDGDSASWGSFASDSSLRLVSETELTRLNGYKPAVSINESGIGFAGNRVSALVLEKIRWRYLDDETQHEMVAPIDISSDLDP